MKINLELLRKWRGEINGPRIIFPTSWHRDQYKRELASKVTRVRKQTPSIWRAAHA